VGIQIRQRAYLAIGNVNDHRDLVTIQRFNLQQFTNDHLNRFPVFLHKASGFSLPNLDVFDLPKWLESVENAVALLKSSVAPTTACALETITCKQGNYSVADTFRINGSVWPKVS
jgi:hypothetical protein